MKQHIPIMGVLGLLIGCSASDESMSMKSDDSSEYMETSNSADYGATDTSTETEAGGDWDDGPEALRSAKRRSMGPSVRARSIGFRLTRNP